MADTTAAVLRSAWNEFLDSILLNLPHFLAMASLVLAGWLIAWLLAFILRAVLRLVRFDLLSDRAGLASMLARAGMASASEVTASMAFWLVWAAFVISGLGALGLEGTGALTSAFVMFVPRLGVAVGLLLIGVVAANFVWRATLLAAVNANLPSARLLSSTARWLILVLSAAMALEQVGVAKTIVLTAFAIAFGAVMLGVAVAIGIGGAPVARRLLERQFPDKPHDETKQSPDVSHL
ncbi:MAG: hypothetical protein IT348_10695 [Candidatus Eisenbacteria bacterium]|nr:hypothetical protein [Candidatus Eisenbacteria bacterium]